MVFNITNSTESTNLMELAQSTNGILGGYYFGYFTLMIVFFVIFIVLKQKGYFAAACFAVASWVTAFLAIVLYPMQLIDPLTMWMCIMLIPASVFMMFMTGNPD